MPNILFLGDNHGHFRHIIAAVEREKPDAIVLLGDVQAKRPLEVELAPILGKTVIRHVCGNHDTDSDFDYRNLFEAKLAGGDLGGRVETIAGVRIAGLGGIFRGKVWMPPEPPIYDSYDELGAVEQAAAGRVRPEIRNAGTNTQVDDFLGRLQPLMGPGGRRLGNA